MADIPTRSIWDNKTPDTKSIWETFMVDMEKHDPAFKCSEWWKPTKEQS